MTEAEEFEFRARAEAEAAASGPAPVTFKGSMSEINKGLGRGLVGLPLAVGKGLEGAMPPPREGALVQPPQADPNVTAARDALIAKLKATPRNQFEQMVGTGAELGASALPFAGAGAGSIPQKLVGFAAPIAGGVTGEQVAGEQGKMIGSLAAAPGVALLGRTLAPRLSPELQLLSDEGVKLTTGQQTDGFLKKFENFPIIKEITSSAKNRSVESFNKAVINVALKPLGLRVNEIGFKGFDKADKLASQAYDDILPKLTVKYDPQFSAEMSRQRAAAPRAVRADLEDLFQQEVTSKIPQGSANIPPRLMKEIDSELGRLARRYTKDPAINSQNMADGIRDIQGAFRDMVTRQNPQHAKELQKVNEAWNNLVRVGNAVERAGNNVGVFTPQQFQTSVKMMDSSLRRKAFQTGRAPMQDIANAGVKVIGDDASANIPYAALRGVAGTAGTAGGLAGGAAALGAGSMALPIAGGAATLAGLYTNPAQRMAQMALTGPRPQSVRTLGEALRGVGAGPTLGTLPLFTQGEQ